MQEDIPEPGQSRRSFSLTAVAMGAGLAGGYGTMGYIAFEFLKPQRGSRKGWLFVRPVAEFEVGASLRYQAPDGATINITRRGSSGTVDDFKALSSVCPHLGCQVHWQQQNNRYFCPCHNGTFDQDGKGTGGPPGDAGQSLGSYPLRVQDGLLFIEVPIERLAQAGSTLDELPRCDHLCGPGHDPCLQPRRPRGDRPA